MSGCFALVTLRPECGLDSGYSSLDFQHNIRIFILAFSLVVTMAWYSTQPGCLSVDDSLTMLYIFFIANLNPLCVHKPVCTKSLFLCNRVPSPSSLSCTHTHTHTTYMHTLTHTHTQHTTPHHTTHTHQWEHMRSKCVNTLAYFFFNF